MSKGDEVLVKYGNDDYHRAKLVRWVSDDKVEVQWLDDAEFEGSTTVVSVNCVHMSFDKRIKLGKRKALDDLNRPPKRSSQEIYTFVQLLSDELAKVRKENAELRDMLTAQAKDNEIKMRESQQEIDASFQRFIKHMEEMAADAKQMDQDNMKSLKQQIDENNAGLESKIDGVIEFVGKAAKFNLTNFKKIHDVLGKKN